MNGTNGTNGTNGNANVKGSAVYMDSTAWVWESLDNDYYVNITDSAIDNGVAENGAVMVYLSPDNQTTWLPLPYTYVNPVVTNYYSFNYKAYHVQLTYQRSDLNTYAPNENFYFKIVAIAASFRETHPNFNWNNYNEFMQAIYESVNTSASKAQLVASH